MWNPHFGIRITTVVMHTHYQGLLEELQKQN